MPHISLSLCVESTQGLPSAEIEYIFMLRPKEKMDLELPVGFPHIGQYNVTIKRLRFLAFWGFSSLSANPRHEERFASSRSVTVCGAI